MAARTRTDEEVATFRARVVGAATELFAERGPNNVTMRQIAAAVGVSPMTAYSYFKDREAILDAVRVSAMERFADTLERAATTDHDSVRASRAVSRAYVAFAQENPSTYRLLFDFERPEAEQDTALAAASARARRVMSGYVEALIGSGVISGDAEAIGMAFWSAMHGILVLELSGALGREIDAEKLRQCVFRALLSGIRNRPPDNVR